MLIVGGNGGVYTHSVPMVLDLLLRLLRAPTPQPTLELLQAVFARLTSGYAFKSQRMLCRYCLTCRLINH